MQQIVFWQGGRIASEVVIIHSKRMPILMYGQQACRLNKADICSLDFVVNRFYV